MPRLVLPVVLAHLFLNGSNGTCQTDLVRKSLAQKSIKPEAAVFEARLLDNSSLKIGIKEEKLELVTQYGKLLIPVADIRRLELGLRIDDETEKRVRNALVQLGSNVFRNREEASQELLSLRDKAYPALLAASQQPDPEIARRAEKLLTQLREQIPAELLEVPAHDVLHTVDSRITGRISQEVLRVQTSQFGMLQLKLADVRWFRLLGVGEPESGGQSNDPGNLMAFAGQVGKTLSFRVTGSAEGNLWGTGVHTLDSSLAKAAVHAGILRPGQTGMVKVTILPPQAAYVGATQNGVTSSNYGAFGQGSFRVDR